MGKKWIGFRRFSPPAKGETRAQRARGFFAWLVTNSQLIESRYQCCVMANPGSCARFSCSGDEMHSRDTVRDVDVIPGIFNFDFVEVRPFDICNREYALMQSTLDCKQVMPVHVIHGYDRTIGPQPDCSTHSG